MSSFESRVSEALNVGAWKLEDKTRERFIATPELQSQIYRIMGIVPTQGREVCNGAMDVVERDPDVGSTILYTLKSHPQSSTSKNTLRYNEVDLRFIQAVQIQGVKLELTSIFHTEDLNLLKLAELVGGRKVTDFGIGPLGFPLKLPKFPELAPAYDSIEEAQRDVEKLCPATSLGMTALLSQCFTDGE